MSNYHRFHCLDCDTADYDNQYGNHTDEAMCWVLRNRKGLLEAMCLGAGGNSAIFVDVDVKVNGHYLNLDWFKKHEGHYLVVMSEYRDYRYDALHNKTELKC